MRMMMKVRIPVEGGNKALKEGLLQKTMMTFVEQSKPESSYFMTENGNRTAFFVIDMKDSSMMPAMAEPFFLNLHATVEFSPCMNIEDLKSGLDRLPKH
jgi:hypothetical protein